MLTARTHRYSLRILFTLFLVVHLRLAPAQETKIAAEATPLTVQPGVALHVALVKPVPVKKSGVAVEGRLVEPIFVFDRMVIPAGSQILGRVASVEGVSRKKRALAIANGDFTPLRKAHVDFDTLALQDGTRLA